MRLLVDMLVQYRRLAAALNPNDDKVHVENIVGFEWARLGVMRDSVVLLLPPAPDGDDRAPAQDLEIIRINPRQEFEVQQTTTSKFETVAVIATKSRDAQVVETFLELVAMLFATGVRSDPESVKKLIQDLVLLFRALAQQSRKSTQGLWGELLMIDHSVDVELAVKAWHSSTNDRYDFARGHERVEVKTTTGPRIHTFAHAQLASVEGLRVTIASLVLSPSTDGCTCADLASRILLKLPGETLRRQVVDQVVRTVGVDWKNQSSFRFDVDRAIQNLRFFDVGDVPKISSPIPAHISGITYQSDLQVVAELNTGSFQPRDELHLAMCRSNDK